MMTIAATELSARQRANRRYYVAERADPVLAERRRQRNLAYKAAHRAERRAYHEAMRANPVLLEVMRERSRTYNVSHRQERNAYLRRRELAKAGITLIVAVEADHCGVCLEPLTDARYPEPLSTTIGHEPPVSRAAREGWLVIVERPEHWACNSRKQTKLDCEIAA